MDSTNFNVKKTIANQPSSVVHALMCAIFFKTNKNNGLKCETCNFIVHKKYINLCTLEIFEIKLSKSKNWEFLKCQTHKFSLVSINNQKDAKKQHLTQFFSGNINLLSPTDINGKYVFQFYTSNSNEKTALCHRFKRYRNE